MLLYVLVTFYYEYCSIRVSICYKVSPASYYTSCLSQKRLWADGLFGENDKSLPGQFCHAAVQYIKQCEVKKTKLLVSFCRHSIYEHYSTKYYEHYSTCIYNNRIN